MILKRSLGDNAMRRGSSSPTFIRSLFQESCAKGAIEKENPLEIRCLVGDASERKYYRVITSSSNTYIVCLDSLFHDENYPFLEVQRFLSEIGIRVPFVYDIDPSSGYLLEEDLGEKTLLGYSAGFTEKRELEVYKECIDTIVKYQSHLFSKDRHSFEKLIFDTKKFNEEVDFAINHFFRFLIEDDLPKWKSEIESIRVELRKVNDIICEKSKVFTHRDFHSRNIMVKNDELAVIDFQDARMGIPQYDLVSLIDDCYYELNNINKESIQRYYFKHISQIVDDQKNYDDFIYLYDLVCIQRTFKVLGTFSSLFNIKSNSQYLKYIGFAFEKLRKTISKYSEFHHFKKSLTQIYYEN